MCRSCLPSFLPIDGFRTEFSRSEFLGTAAVAAGALASLLPRAADATASGADVIFHGGTIVPLAGPQHSVRALAVRDGKIVAVGSEADVGSMKSASTRVVDLKGRTLLPGFIDAHQHTVTGALVTALFVDAGYPKYKSRAAVLELAKDLASKAKPGGWVYLMNYDNLLQGGDLSMADLDGVSTTVPVMVYYINMHTATGNGIAFEQALAKAKIPSDVHELPGGGRFGRDATGKFDGMIYEESALKPFLIGIPSLTPALASKAVTDWLRANALAGNTSIHEAGVLVLGNLLDSYERVLTESQCRASISLMFDSMAHGDRYKAYGIGARAAQVPNTLFSAYAVKIVADGSNQAMTAAQTVPYLNSTESGSMNYDPAELKEMVAAVKARGWPVSIHSNGDATLDAALDAIEAVYGEHPVTGVNRIEHCTITRPEQIVRMKRLGVQPSFLMNHVHFYGAAYRDQLFGPARANRMDPAGQCVEIGLPFTLHTDAPCSNIGTLQLVQTAVTRICSVDGSVVGKDQAISVREALKAVTVYAAGQIGMHDRLGTLEPGKEADLTILEDDPFAVDPNKIRDIKVSETWIAGKKVSG
jgi:predicted amidohydrolase YtcJ